MAKDLPSQLRRKLRRFRPTHDTLEKRRLLSLDLVMLGQSPLMEGSAVPSELASFSFNTSNPVTDYSASVSWGDGTSSSGEIYQASAGMAVVVASHAYSVIGTESISVSVTGQGGDGGEGGSGTTTVDVVGAPLTASAVSITPTANESWSGAVADFTDLDISVPASAFTASITWGDGGTSDGTITSLGSGSFAVSGTHTYSDADTYDMQVAVSGGADTSASAGFAVHVSGSDSETPLTGDGVSVSATPLGASLSAALAVFDGGTLDTTTGYTATINWGDGTTSGGQFAPVSEGIIYNIRPVGGSSTSEEVTGTHTYSAAGTYPITVTVEGTNGDIATAGTSAVVTQTGLTLDGTNLSGTAGQTVGGVVANVTDINPGDEPGDLTALIDWGDSTTSDGLVVFDPVSGFDVIGDHIYAESATYPITVTVTGATGSASVTSTAAIADAALTGYETGVQSTEGSAFSGAVATVVSANPDESASDLTATITWGDGTSPTTGTVAAVANAPGEFTVSGSHTYSAAGTYDYTIDVVDHGGSTVTIDGTAVVAAAALALASVSFSSTAGTSYSGNVATFTDANADAAAGNFSAAVNWGDGTTSTGTVAANGSGGFKVTGAHAYAQPGVYAVTVDVAGPGGAGAVVEETATVADASITATTVSVSASDAGPFTGLVATFTDANPYVSAADFAAIITWDDSSTTIGTVTADPTVSGQFDVTGTNTFATVGDYTTSVEIIDQDGGTATVSGTAAVTEPTPAVTVVPASAQAGAAFSGAVATFIAGGGDPIDDFTATIDWGDGTPTTTGTITVPGTTPDQFTVTGSHTYADVGQYEITATVTQTTGADASDSATGTAYVSNIVATPASITPSEGVSFSDSVATFTDSGTTSASGFTATIDWGDGTAPSSGTVTYDSGEFDVSGTHTYAVAGTFPVSIEITNADGNWVTLQGTATVADAAMTVTAADFSTSEGTTFSGNAASFTDANPEAVAADFGALIEWGDGSYSVATITADPDVSGQFDISGTHIYAEQGTYSAVVELMDQGGGAASVTDTVTVADTPLTALFVAPSVLPGVAFTGTVATFTGGPVAPASEFSATIDWGDGTSTTTGTVTAPVMPGGPWTVTGTHTYASEGSYSVSVSIGDDDSDSATASGTALVTSITGTGATIVPAAGVAFSGQAGTFQSTISGASASSFTATIDWGDGSSSPGTVTADPTTAGLYDVSGTHTYASAGTDSFTVTISDGTTSATIIGTAVVASPPLAISPAIVSAQAGVSDDATVATFTTLAGSTASQFTAVINWGDGSAPTSGTITAVTDTPGAFVVTGSHTYASEGSDTVTITITQTDGTTATALDTADVSAMDTTARAVSAVEGATSTMTLVTFTDADSGVTASSFTATINWGDGQTSIGTVTADPDVSGQFDVAGTHVYAQSGSFAFSVSIVDSGGHTAIATGSATVSAATMTVANAAFSVTAGMAFEGVVAIITDSNPDATTEEFTATVNWGDGSPASDASIVPVPGQPGEFDVLAEYSYATPGTYSVTVAVESQGWASSTVTSTATVAAALLAGTFIAPSLSPGVCSTVTVATFSEGDDVTAADFTATIDWGDGSDPTTGTIVAPSGPGQPLSVTGTYDYAAAGVYTVTVTINDNYGNSITLAGNANVTNVAGTGTSITAVEGYAYSGAVATFTDPNTSDNAASYAAIVNWGDGGSSVATITEGTEGSYTVRSSYVYETQGTYATSVTLVGPGGTETVIAGTATAADSPLVVTGVAFNATAEVTSTVAVATFTKGGSYVPGDFVATIDWGDGTSTEGTIVAPSPADPDVYTVTGSHDYSTVGDETVTVTVTEPANGDSDEATLTAAVTNMAPASASFSVREGSAYSGTVATLSDTQSGVTESSFSVSINWGDGDTSSGTVSGEDGQFTISGSHTYALAGTYHDTITITDAGDNVVVVEGTATVTDAAMTASASSFSATAGTAYTGAVATFTTADTALTSTDFTAAVTWGDGDVTTGMVTADGSGEFTVSGSHVYLAGGSMAVSVMITDQAGNTVSASETVDVADAAFVVTVPAISATTGNGFSGLVATFTADPSDPASDFTATIDWGDGSETTGTITSPNTPTGSFQISGQHTYADTGSDSVSVTVAYTASDGSTSTFSGTGTAAVSDLAVSGQTVQATEGALFSGTVATFADVSSSSLVDASATITWGDGTSTSTGVITPDPSAVGLYDVGGSHVYAESGTDTITISVTDDDSTGSGTSTAAVADAPITAVSSPVSPTAGEPFTSVVATFTDADTSKIASDFTATITWGDGVTSTATIAADPSVAYQFDVTGTHTYTEAASDDLTVDVQDVAGASASADETVDVADAPLTGVARTIAATAGAQYSGVAAVFSDPNSDATSADFTATITWGDGGQSTATVSSAGDGDFDVSGTYTYEQYGTYSVTVQVSSSGGSSLTVDSTADVADAALSAATNPSPPQPTAGAQFDGTLADFTDANSYATAAQFTATITWGDGSSSAGTVSSNGAGGFEVEGTHTYTTYGTDSVSVAVTSAGSSTLTVPSTITVADAAISVSGTAVTVSVGDEFSGEIATFTDANPYATASQFTASINWNDGNTTTGTVTLDPEFYDQFDVSGTHTYTTPGSFPVFITVSDGGGESATAQSSATSTSANAAQATAAGAAAGAFNTEVNGTGDTNTSSFDLGFISVAAMDGSANTGGADGDTGYSSANSAGVSLGSGSSVPASGSYSYTTTINESGTDWTLTETTTFAYLVSVSGTSTDGSFYEQLEMTIKYVYVEDDMGIWLPSPGFVPEGTLYDQTTTTVIVATAAGNYWTSDGVTAVSGQYTDLQKDSNVSELIEGSHGGSTGSGPGYSNSLLTEDSDESDAYDEIGGFSGGPGGTATSGSSSYSLAATYDYDAGVTATTFADGATIIVGTGDEGSATLSYVESDIFATDDGELSDAGTFDLYESTVDTSGSIDSVTSRAGTALAIASQTTDVSLVDKGTIGQLGGVASAAGTFTLSGTAQGTESLTASGNLTGGGVTGTYSASLTATDTADIVFTGTVGDVGGTDTLNGTLTGTSSAEDDSSVTDTGTFSSTSSSTSEQGKFSNSTTGTSTSSATAKGEVVVVGDDTAASGSEASTTTGNSTALATMSGSYSGDGNNGQFSASSSTTGSLNETDTESFVATNTTFTANGASSLDTLQDSDQTYSDSGAITYTPTGSTTPTTLGYSLGQQATSTLTTTETASFALTSAGYTINAQITQTASTAATTNGTDAGVLTTSISGGGSSLLVYTMGQNSGATGSSTLVTNIAQTGSSVSASGTFNISEEGAGSSFYSASENYTSGSSSASDLTCGSEVYTQSGDDSYSVETQGTFSGSVASGTYQSALNSTSSWDDTITETAIGTGSGGRTSASYSVASGGGNAVQDQVSETFSPAGASGSFAISQSGNRSFSQDNTEQYTQSGPPFAILPGGVWPVTATDSGESSLVGGSSTEYTYETTGSFTPATSTGTYLLASSGSEQYSGGSEGILTGSFVGSDESVAFSDGYNDAEVIQTASYAYQDSGSYSDSSSTGVATQSGENGQLITSSATEQFTVQIGNGSTTGTLDSSDESGALSVYTSATSYSPNSSSTTFSESVTAIFNPSVSDAYGTDGAAPYRYDGTSFTSGQTNSTISGTVINGTAIISDSISRSGSKGYTDVYSSTSAVPYGEGSYGWSDSGVYSWDDSSSAQSTTSPQGSVISQSENFSVSNGGSQTYGMYNDSSVSFTYGGSTTTTFSSTTSTQSYTWSSTYSGTASGIGTDASTTGGFSISQGLSVSASTVETGFGEESGSMSSTSATESTTATETYTDSGTLSDTGTSESISDSPNYTASGTVSISYSSTDSAGSSSSTETTLYEKNTSATETVAAGVVTATYGQHADNSVSLVSVGSNYSSTGTNSETYTFSSGNESYWANAYQFADSTVTVNGTVSASSGSSAQSMSYSVTAPMPSLETLGQWVGLPSGSGGFAGSTSGSSGGGSGSGSGSSSGLWGSSSSSGFAGSSSSGLLGSSSSSSSSSSSASGTPAAAALNSLGQSMQQLITGGVFVPGGAITMPGMPGVGGGTGGGGAMPGAMPASMQNGGAMAAGADGAEGQPPTKPALAVPPGVVVGPDTLNLGAIGDPLTDFANIMNSDFMQSQLDALYKNYHTNNPNRWERGLWVLWNPVTRQIGVTTIGVTPKGPHLVHQDIPNIPGWTPIGTVHTHGGNGLDGLRPYPQDAHPAEGTPLFPGATVNQTHYQPYMPTYPVLVVDEFNQPVLNEFGQLEYINLPPRTPGAIRRHPKARPRPKPH